MCIFSDMTHFRKLAIKIVIWLRWSWEKSLWTRTCRWIRLACRLLLAIVKFRSFAAKSAKSSLKNSHNFGQNRAKKNDFGQNCAIFWANFWQVLPQTIKVWLLPAKSGTRVGFSDMPSSTSFFLSSNGAKLRFLWPIFENVSYPKICAFYGFSLYKNILFVSIHYEVELML